MLVFFWQALMYIFSGHPSNCHPWKAEFFARKLDSKDDRRDLNDFLDFIELFLICPAIHQFVCG